MAEIAVQGLLEFWPCKSENNPNFGLPIMVREKARRFQKIETIQSLQGAEIYGKNRISLRLPKISIKYTFNYVSLLY